MYFLLHPFLFIILCALTSSYPAPVSAKPEAGSQGHCGKYQQVACMLLLCYVSAQCVFAGTSRKPSGKGSEVVPDKLLLLCSHRVTISALALRYNYIVAKSASSNCSNGVHICQCYSENTISCLWFFAVQFSLTCSLDTFYFRLLIHVYLMDRPGVT